MFTGNNLVPNVVTQNVLVLAESINRPGVLVQYICRPKGIETVNGAIHGQSKINSVVAQVSKRNVLGGKVSQHGINACRIEGTHTAVMIE